MTAEHQTPQENVSPGALNGWRVLDLGIITAGAATSALLADAGAEVIKIESPTRPDPFRTWTHDGTIGDQTTSPVFAFTNRNKLGLGLDLKKPEGRNLFLKMVGQSDVVVENFRRGVLENLGLSYQELKQANPRIVLASISSQGETGPDRTYSSFGSTLEATGGLAALTGYENGPPVITGRNFNYPDQIVSIYAMGMIIAAVLSARRIGQGSHLDISQREVTAFLIGESVTAALEDNGSAQCPRRGNLDPGGDPQFVLRSKDVKWVAITLIDEAAVVNVRELVSSNRPMEDLQSAVGCWLQTKDATEAVEELRHAGAAAALVLNGSNVLTSECTAFTHGASGELVKGFPFQSRKNPFLVSRSAPEIGENTETLLTTNFACAKDHVRNLIDEKIVFGLSD